MRVMRGTFNSRLDFAAERPKIDGLGQKRFGAPFQSLPFCLSIAIGGDHDNRDVRPRGLRLGQKLKAAHTGHVDVRQNQDERLIASTGDELKCRIGGLGKFHRESARAKIVPKLLPEQNLHVRLVINHENKQVHYRSPDLATVAARRGRTILNSVNSPGRVSTSIDPPCCAVLTCGADQSACEHEVGC